MWQSFFALSYMIGAFKEPNLFVHSKFVQTMRYKSPIVLTRPSVIIYHDDDLYQSKSHFFLLKRHVITKGIWNCNYNEEYKQRVLSNVKEWYDTVSNISLIIKI